MVGAPLFEIDYRPTEDLIRTKITGFWRPADADVYFAKLIPVMTQLRLRDGRAKVLADRPGGVPQSAETLSRTIYWYDRAYLPGDMSAVVVDTSLLKLVICGLATVRAMPSGRSRTRATIRRSTAAPIRRM